jgi:hypothetical protein
MESTDIEVIFSYHIRTRTSYLNSYRVSVGKPEGKKPLGRPGRRWESNVKMDLGEIG